MLKAEDTRVVPGGVGEIGVHHGKLFLLAYLASRRDGAAFAVDVFEQQAWTRTPPEGAMTARSS